MLYFCIDYKNITFVFNKDITLLRLKTTYILEAISTLRFMY